MRSIKEECLDRMIFVGQAALRRAVSEFVAHYHRERNHQGLRNRLIQPEPRCLAAGASIYRRERLGGMLSFYYPGLHDGEPCSWTLRVRRGPSSKLEIKGERPGERPAGTSSASAMAESIR